MTSTEIITLIVVPLCAAIIGAVLAFGLPVMQSWYRNRLFRKLILRELAEARPFPATPDPNGTWVDHMRKDFIHRKIFENPDQGNIDKILSLNSDFAYKVGQLWSSVKEKNVDQFLYYLDEITSENSKAEPELNDVLAEWQNITGSYAATPPQTRRSL
jgi:hypothetical protein